MRGGRREGAGRPKGAKNQRTVAVEEAMQVVAEKFRAEVPIAFSGDSIAFLQTVYKDPRQPLELRMQAASLASRFERPALSAVAVQQAPKTRIDLSMLSPDERAAMVGMLKRAMGMTATGEPAIESVASRD